MLQNVQDAAWNETSHPKLVHVYFLSHRTIPAIQSNKDIHNTQLNHIFTQPLSIVIFHTPHRATGSSLCSRSLLTAIQNFSLVLTEAGIINTTQYTTTHTWARALPRTNEHQHIHTHTHTHHTHTHTRERTLEERKRQVIVLLAKE